jgi:hypothetical protein
MMVLCLFSMFTGQFSFGFAPWLKRWAQRSATCPALGSGLSPALCLPSCLSSVCLLIIHAENSSLPILLCPVHFQHSCPLCCYARLQFTVCYSVFLWGVSLPIGCAGLSQGWLGEFYKNHGAHLFALSNVSQAGLEQAAAALLCWLCSRSQMLGAIKGWFVGHFFEFFSCT